MNRIAEKKTLEVNLRSCDRYLLRLWLHLSPRFVKSVLNGQPILYCIKTCINSVLSWPVQR